MIWGLARHVLVTYRPNSSSADEHCLASAVAQVGVSRSLFVAEYCPMILGDCSVGSSLAVKILIEPSQPTSSQDASFQSVCYVKTGRCEEKSAMALALQYSNKSSGMPLQLSGTALHISSWGLTSITLLL